jgi:hypothetical protein
MTMRTLRRLTVAAGLVFVLGCASGCVISEFPLSEPAPSDADKLLYGRWRVADGQASSVSEFAAATDATPKVRGLGNDRVMVLTVARYEKDERQPAFASSSRAFVTQIADASFLNVYDEQERGYRILRYRIDGDTLDIWRMDENATAEALRRGDLIAGEVTYDKGSASRVLIKTTLKEDGTSKTKLRALLTGKDAERIFADHCKTRYTRVKDKK